MPELIDDNAFNAELDGVKIGLFNLQNENGLVVQITNYGGRVVSLWVPDKYGNFEDIVFGYESLDRYLNSSQNYFGAIVGRCVNRIANGKFTLNDTVYTLPKNNNAHHINGGINGFNNVVWNVEKVDETILVLTYLSPDMEEGYPGDLQVQVNYQLTEDNKFIIEYRATTNKPCPVNMTHHSFFNLHGAGSGSINDHIMQINADYYTPVNNEVIPTGEIAKVEGTPMDFRKPTVINDRINSDFEQLKFSGGYGHNWVLNQSGNGLTFAARLVEPVSGRVMEVYTNEPGLQLYGGNNIAGFGTGKGGKVYGHRGGFCLESQHYPDSPNQKNFPSIILYPGEKYYSICEYKFGVVE